MTDNKFKIISLGRELDTYDDELISFTYQISDIEDITSKNSSYSKTIRLPGTPTNNEYFKNIGEIEIDISNTTYNPKQVFPVKVLIGDERVFEGNLQLLNVIKDHDLIEYEVVITGIFKNIIVSFGDYTLNQLDLEKYNHYRNNTTIEKSWDNQISVNDPNTEVQVNIGEGYTYPLIINGNNSITTGNQLLTLNTFDLNPAVYVKTIMDELFNFAGYTYTSKFFNSEYFRSLITPTETPQMTTQDILNKTVRVSYDNNFVLPTNIPLEFNNFLWTNIAGYVPLTAMIPKSNTYWVNADTSCHYTPLKLEEGVFESQQLQDPGDNWNNDCPYEYTCTQSGFYSIDYRNDFHIFYRNLADVNFTYLSGDIRYNVTIRKVNLNGVSSTITQLNSQGQLITPPTAGDTGIFNGNAYTIPSNGSIPPNFLHTSEAWTSSLVVPSVWLNEGEKIRINFRLLQSNNLNWAPSVFIGAMSRRIVNGGLNRLEIKPSTTNIYNPNELIRLSQFLPNMKMKDYFLNIVKMFNLIITENPNKENDLIIEPRDDFFRTKQKIKDWTYKLDYDNDIKITPMSELDVRSYKFGYKKDNDYYNKVYQEESNKVYGDYEVNFLNDFSVKDKKLELDFAPTPISDNLLNTFVAPFLCDKNDGVLKPQKTLPRILFSKKSSRPGKFYVMKTLPTSLGTPYNTFMYAGMYDDPLNPTYTLEWGNSDTLYYDTSLCCPDNTLVNQFYLSTLYDITDVNAKLMEAYFHLTPSDINDFDFRDIILIDNTYWRVNKIVDYNPLGIDKLTKVILFKLNNLDLIIGKNNQVADSPGVGCPTDVIAVNQSPFGFIYISQSGQELSEDCCRFYGGTYVNGICRASTGVGSIVLDPLPGPGPDKKNKIIDIGTKSGLVLTERPQEELKDFNIKNSDNVIVKGQFNYVDYGVENGIVMGSNNTILNDVKNTFIVGDDMEVGDSNSIVIDGLIINGEGIKDMFVSIIDGGVDDVMNNSKNNFIDIIDGGVDSVRNFGGDSKERPIIQGGYLYNRNEP